MDALSILASTFGWTYFVIWSATFYPQVALILKRKHGSGFSIEYMIINFVGFSSYSIFTCSSYFIPKVIQSYIKHSGYPPQVDTNDVFFAVHGAVLCVVLLAELAYFPPRTMPSLPVLLSWSVIQAAVMVGFFLATNGILQWYAYLNFTGLVKALSSLVKHIPQVLLNRSRGSTVGFSFTMICLDVIGGFFSIAQQIVKCFMLTSLAPFTSNYAKTFLAIESLAFDFYFMAQHLIWFTDRTDHDRVKTQTEDAPLVKT